MNTYYASVAAALAAHPWAMEPTHLRLKARRAHELVAASSAPHASLFEPLPDPDEAAPGHAFYDVEDGVALINVVGDILDQVPAIYSLSDCPATAMPDLIEAIKGAAADAAVRSILLYVNSPGGIITGMEGEMQAALAAARAAKPVHAHVENVGASAAYWIASQADIVSASETSRVGSIGVYLYLEDWSGACAAAGVKPLLIRSGPLKGTGAGNAPISDAEIAVLQEEIDALAGLFVDAVAAGRRMDRDEVQALATGRCWLAHEARALGLIDKVVNFDAAFAALAAARPQSTTTPLTKEVGMNLIDRLRGRKPADDEMDPEVLATEAGMIASEAEEAEEAPTEAVAATIDEEEETQLSSEAAAALTAAVPDPPAVELSAEDRDALGDALSVKVLAGEMSLAAAYRALAAEAGAEAERLRNFCETEGVGGEARALPFSEAPTPAQSAADALRLKGYTENEIAYLTGVKFAGRQALIS